jgi:U32 family peptidase
MQQIVRRKAGDFVGPKPEILAPAGNKDAFLAALAAGADAVYCGLKAYSARMAAQNFTVEELAVLAQLARDRKVKLYLTFNTLLKPDELIPAGRQLEEVQRLVQPDALIIQDLAVAELAKQVGYKGEIHLSTLANVSMSGILSRLPKAFGIQRVVMPRELDVEEIRQMAAACPTDLSLEIFVHGALCYGVSGRCYWSSFLGGKSGLRGRCVQPCRRSYSQGKDSQRYFSCRDLSLDVLTKVLSGIPQIRAWKIEGRKKGPHYVYYTTTAYKMLRDEGQDNQMKKAAVQLLEQSLGRPGTHYHFLPQRPQNPIDIKEQSGSGMLVGAVRGECDKAYIQPRIDLLAMDRLRIGYEEDAWHQTLDLSKGVPKKGKFFFKPFRGRVPAKGTPVFLIDRREAALTEQMEALGHRLETIQPSTAGRPSAFNLRLSPSSPKKPRVRLMHVMRKAGRRQAEASLALWLDPNQSLQIRSGHPVHAWWWLPPVIWPSEEARWQDAVSQLVRQGAHRFVLNAPWQVALFKPFDGLSLWAGPFCNCSNPLAIRAFKIMGGQGVIVSPELGHENLQALADKSVLPLGIVVSGFWPFCVSRVLAEDLKTRQPIVSPKQEQGWAVQYGQLYWIYPNWPIDLRLEQENLKRAGFRLFVHLDEPVPKTVQIKRRPGRWNWDGGLK